MRTRLRVSARLVSTSLVRGSAVGVPILLAAAMGLLRDVVANTSVALVLVLVIAGIALRGDRAAGILASVSAAAAFDFFLTEPYLRFTILDATDVETAVLLVLVGIAVTELAQWARREAGHADQRSEYLAGVATASRLAGEHSAELTGVVGRSIAEILDLDDCRHTTDASQPERPRFRPDGTVVWRGSVIDVDRQGLPIMDVVELPAGSGMFLLTAATRVRKPTLEQRRLAVTLAGQVARSTGSLR